MRAVAIPAAAALLAATLAGCGGSNDPKTEPSSTPTSACSGGEIRFLQGQPAQLPGGGYGGIGQYFDTDPPTVGLVLGGAEFQASPHLAVGDTFSVASTTYRITCVSRSKVTLEKVS